MAKTYLGQSLENVKKVALGSKLPLLLVDKRMEMESSFLWGRDIIAFVPPFSVRMKRKCCGNKNPYLAGGGVLIYDVHMREGVAPKKVGKFGSLVRKAVKLTGNVERGPMFGGHHISIIPLLKERVRDTADASKLRR